MTWEDLTVEIQGYGAKAFSAGKKLIQGVTGYALPGRVMVIMGPSGSGKSTLLDTLAGRLANNKVVKGTILLNGKKARLEYGGVAYVTQEDTLLSTLTVRETITYSALLRIPSTEPSAIHDVVEGTISQLGLIDCADRFVGNWHLRGISGGERKRLSIALEVLTRPSILFLDEPTTGLDSAAAFFVAAALRQMSRDVGMTIVASVHQPNGQVFEVFDDLCLLAGGEMVYFGDSKMAVEFFRSAGFACPVRRNPSDHFLFCINSDFDQVNKKLSRSRRHRLLEDDLQSVGNKENDAGTIEMETFVIKARLIERYRTSDQAAATRRKILSLCDKDGSRTPVRSANYGTSAVGNPHRATWWRQFTTLVRRSSTNMYRDIGYFWLRTVVYILCCICVGTVFFDVGTSYYSILARTSSAGFVFGYMSIMAIGGFPSLVEEMKVFSRERLNGHYGVGAYIVSSVVASIPFIAVITLCSSAIAYFLLKLHPGWSHFVFFAANLFGCIAVVESIMVMVAAIVPHFLMGIAAGAGIMSVMVLSAGFLRILPELPKPFWRYPFTYLSFGAWALQGQYKNDMIGLEFEPLVPGESKLAGEYVIQTMYGVSLDHSKWLDLASLFFLIIFYRLIAFFILKSRERATTLFRSMYAWAARFLLNTCPASDEVSIGLDEESGVNKNQR